MQSDPPLAIFGRPGPLSPRIAPTVASHLRLVAAEERPHLLHDLAKLRWNLGILQGYLGSETQINFAVKANRDPAILRCLADESCGFQAASPGEVATLLALGVQPERIAFGNPCLTPAQAEQLYRSGIRSFVVETLEGIDMLARIAPDAARMLRVNLTEVADVHVDHGATLRYIRRVIAPAERRERRLTGLCFHGLHPLGLAICGNLIETEFPWVDTVGIGGAFHYAELLPELGQERARGGFEPVAGQIRAFAATYGVRLVAAPGRALVDTAVHAFAHVLHTSSGCHGGAAIHLDLGPMNGLRGTVTGGYAVSLPNVAAPVAVLADFSGSKRTIGRLSPCPLFETGDVLAFANVGAYARVYAAQQTPEFTPILAYVDDGSRPPTRMVRRGLRTVPVGSA